MGKPLTVGQRAARSAWRQRIKLKRKYKITQEHVAEIAGVDRSLVSKCMAGKAKSANVETAFDQVISARMDDERRAIAAKLEQRRAS